MRTNFAKLMKQLRKTFPNADLEVVRRAYRVANKAHQGQLRLSGEPYVLHSLKVGQILAGIGLDPVTCAAGVLHDVLEDTPMTQKELAAEFGEEIARLVDGVTKISTLSFPEEKMNLEVKQAQNIRKMLVATAKDVRVILIKLADRLHNMRTIEFLPREKQMMISRETLDIYAPLAHRLGISRWRWELEDHAFHRLMPEEYREIARQVAMKRRDREALLEEAIKTLEKRLAEMHIEARVIGRPKHLYSIYCKMVKQGKDFSEVQDLQGIRIITRTEAECYNALGAVHSLWTPIPGRMKDYVAMPKFNMYQSIHTTIMRENGHPMEIQIRSEEMDRTAREGIAAHWVYKEGVKHKDKRLDERLAWLQQTYEWLKEAALSEELMESVRTDFTESHIYVFTPKAEVKELPVGATPLDFAYLIHSDIGHQCIQARVNGRIVPLRYNLQTGDVVEILTSKNQRPHLDWIDIVVTGRARTRIRQRLRELGEIEPIEEPQEPRTRRARHYSPPQPPPKEIRHVDEATRQKMIRIEGAKGMSVQFAKCCHPMPGHGIVGYVTKNPGITVHRIECRSFAKSARDPSRIVEASWEGEGILETTMRVIVGPRPNVLADITNALRPMNIDIVRAQYGPADNGKSQLDFTFQVADHKAIDQAERALRALPGVAQVTSIDTRERPLRAMAAAG